MEKERIKNILLILHKEEDDLNKQIGVLDKQVRAITIKKGKLARTISKNMKYRNSLIKQL